MKKLLISGAITLSLLVFSGCNNNDNTTTSSESFDVTVVDGYIKEGNVTDANGQVASEIDATKGLYRFATEPSYPIKFIVGSGKLVDTNMTFDINMSATSGNVISPITTIINGDATTEANLITVLGGNLSSDELNGDYMQANNLDQAKLAQLAYAMLKDTNVTDGFKERIGVNFSATTDTNITALIENTRDNVVNNTLTKNLLTSIESFSGNVSDIENQLSTVKSSFKDCTGLPTREDLALLLKNWGNDFNNATLISQIENFDTSCITDMSNIFHSSINAVYDFGGGDEDVSYLFNLDISKWDVSNVRDMSRMFSYMFDFNQDISKWNVSNVTDMSYMFYSANSFNQDLSSWDTDTTDDYKTSILNTSFDTGARNWNLSKPTFVNDPLE